MATRISIRSLYNKLRRKFDTIHQVDENFISNVEEIYHKQNEFDQTAIYIGIVTMALIFFGYFPSALVIFYNFAVLFETKLSSVLNIGIYLNSHKEAMITILSLLLAIIMYTIYLPGKSEDQLKPFSILSRLFKKKGKSVKKPVEIIANPNKKSLSFVAFVVISYYFLVWGLIILGYSFEFFPKIVVQTITFTWLLIPTLPLLFLPILILIWLFALFLVFRKNLKQKTTEPEYVIAKILILVNKVYEVDKMKYINLNDRKIIAEKINDISIQIRKIYPKTNSSDIINCWAYERMDKVATSFQLLGAKVLLPKEKNLANIIPDIILYLNSFLTVNYFDFPIEKDEKINDFGSPHKQSSKIVLNSILVIIFIALPVVLTGLLTTIINFEIVPVLQTLLSILYTAWILICVLYFSEKLNPDFRTYFFELIKNNYK